MRCESSVLGGKWRRLHALICAECRAVGVVDAALARGLIDLRAERGTEWGLERALAAAAGRAPNRAGSTALFRRTRRRRAAATATPVAVLLAAGLAWNSYTSAMPSVRVQPEVFPSPNAVDTYLKAVQQLKDIIPTQALDVCPGKKFTDSEELDRYCEDDSTSLALIHKALRQPCRAGIAWDRALLQATPGDYSSTGQAFDPAYDGLQTLARLLVLQGMSAERSAPFTQWPALARTPFAARHRHETFASYKQRLSNYEKWLTAVARGYAEQRDLDAIRMGYQLAQGSNISEYLTALDCARTGRRALWYDLNQMGYAEARHVFLALQDLMAQRPGWRAVLKQERQNTEAKLMQDFQLPNWREGLHMSTGWGDWPHLLAVLTSSKRQVLRNYDHAMQSLERQASGRTVRRSAPPDGLTEWLIPNAGTMGWLEIMHSGAEDRLLSAALAVRAYSARCGIYPSSLAEAFQAARAPAQNGRAANAGQLRGPAPARALATAYPPWWNARTGILYKRTLSGFTLTGSLPFQPDVPAIHWTNGTTGPAEQIQWVAQSGYSPSSSLSAWLMGVHVSIRPEKISAPRRSSWQ